MALTQSLGVGTMALIAQASGRKDQGDANLVFNQSISMAAVFGVLTLVIGYAVAGRMITVPLGQGSAFYSGPQQGVWFKGVQGLLA